MKWLKFYSKTYALIGIFITNSWAVKTASAEEKSNQNSSTTQNIMIALNSRTTTDKLNECASMYPSPEEIKFTIIIDEDGNGVLSETEPQVHGLLKACFTKVVGSILFPKTGKKLKVVYSIKFTPPEPKTQIPVPGTRVIEAFPRVEPQLAMELSRGKILSIAGMSVMGVGLALNWASLITAWSDLTQGSATLIIGLIISLSSTPLVTTGSVVSLAGLMTRRTVLGEKGIGISRLPLVLGWVTHFIWVPISILSGIFAVMEGSVVAYDHYNNEFNGMPALITYTLSNIFVITSLIIQITYFLKLEKEAKKGATIISPALRYIPLPSFTFSHPEKTPIINLSWFF